MCTVGVLKSRIEGSTFGILGNGWVDVTSAMGAALRIDLGCGAQDSAVLGRTG